MKCPNCGGRRFKDLGTQMKCVYCNAMVNKQTSPQHIQVAKPQVQNPQPAKPQVQDPQQNVTVHVHNNTNNDKDSFSQGVSTGAGAAAGGCLGGIAMAILGPIIGFILFCSFCLALMQTCTEAITHSY